MIFGFFPGNSCLCIPLQSLTLENPLSVLFQDPGVGSCSSLKQSGHSALLLVLVVVSNWLLVALFTLSVGCREYVRGHYTTCLRVLTFILENILAEKDSGQLSSIAQNQNLE